MLSSEQKIALLESILSTKYIDRLSGIENIELSTFYTNANKKGIIDLPKEGNNNIKIISGVSAEQVAEYLSSFAVPFTDKEIEELCRIKKLQYKVYTKVSKQEILKILDQLSEYKEILEKGKIHFLDKGKTHADTKKSQKEQLKYFQEYVQLLEGYNNARMDDIIKYVQFARTYYKSIEQNIGAEALEVLLEEIEEQDKTAELLLHNPKHNSETSTTNESVTQLAQMLDSQSLEEKAQVTAGKKAETKEENSITRE